MPNGMKETKGKVRLELIPPDWITGMGEVLTYGAAKYTDYNWLEVDDPQDIYYAAAMRHIMRHRNGEYLDEESGLPHLLHAITDLQMVNHTDKSTACLNYLRGSAGDEEGHI